MSDSVDLIRSIAKTIDDVFDKVVGGRPVERLLDIAESLAPASIARKLNIPPPGDIVDRAVQEIENAIKYGRLPSPAEELRRIFGR